MRTLREVEFEAWIKSMPRAELGGLLKEYVAESNHNSWDGWDRRDMSGVRNLFEDLRRYYYGVNDPSKFATHINNVNPVP